MKLILKSTVFSVALLTIAGEPLYGSAAADALQQPAAVTAAPLAGPNRPSNVPEGHVVTPFGFFHASCLQSLARGERLLADGRIQHANGSTNTKVAVCQHPHYLRSGVVVNAANARTSPQIDGWVESASITTGSTNKSYGALIANWTVPPQPYANQGQVLYFFPGFEDINNPQTTILQPVLGWYQGQWSIASWNCCLNGMVSNSPAVAVNTGDRIYGSITSTCPPGTLSCATWNVLSLDLSTGESTTLSDTPSEGQVFNRAFGGVLEAYFIDSCDAYPADQQLTFDRVTVFDESLHPLGRQKWSQGFDSSHMASPRHRAKLSSITSCGYEIGYFAKASST
ncbi:MAG TPA: hypothetical protein VF126_03320 [Acidobacteriaceae bacterium]